MPAVGVDVAIGLGVNVGLAVEAGAKVGIGIEVGVQADAAVEVEVAVEVAVAVEVGVAVGLAVATVAPVACISATPTLAIGGSPPCTSECIQKSTPAPNAPMVNSDPNTAFADIVPRGRVMRVSLGGEVSLAPSIDCGPSGIWSVPHDVGVIRSSSRLWFVICHTCTPMRAKAGPSGPVVTPELAPGLRLARFVKFESRRPKRKKRSRSRRVARETRHAPRFGRVRDLLPFRPMTLHPPTRASQTSPSNTPSPRKAILVVDDDEGMREALYALLSSEYRVTLAVDGIDGYLKAHEQPPQDLIIADVCMPQLDGITMVRRIRENDVLRHVPVIFFTGRMPPANLITRQAVGPVACLPKPIDPDVLENSVKLALSGVRTQPEGDPRV